MTVDFLVEPGTAATRINQQTGRQKVVKEDVTRTCYETCGGRLLLLSRLFRIFQRFNENEIVRV
jgi:hypothetical protein